MKAQRLQRAGDRQALGDVDPVRGLRLQQVPRRGLRPGVVLDGVPQGRGTRPSTWPRCSPRCATTRTRARSTCTSAGGWASRCCRRTSTPPTPTSRRSAPTSATAWPASATSGTTSSRRSARPASSKGAYAELRRLPGQGRAGRLQQEGHRVADQGRRVRLARPHPAGTAAGPRRGDRRLHGHQARRGGRPVRPVRRRATSDAPAEPTMAAWT